MIGKIVKGSHSGAVVRYLLTPARQTEARIVSSNIRGSAIDMLARTYEPITVRTYAAVREAVMDAQELVSTRDKKYTNNVTHIAVGFDPKDGEIKRTTKKQVAIKLLAKLGYTLTPYIAIEHRRDDPAHLVPLDHDHIHIWTTPVDYDGKLVDTRNDYAKVHQAMREIETELKLEPFRNLSQRQELDYMSEIQILPQEEYIENDYRLNTLHLQPEEEYSR